MRPYVVEETYELIEAIEDGDPSAFEEELGDLLFQIVLLSQMAADAGQFDVERVAAGIAAKLKRRHPQIFDPDWRGDAPKAEPALWESIKAAEKSRGSILDGIPAHLPALARAHKASEKAARVGFDWRDLASVRAKLDEELQELDEALASGDAAAIRHELGDVLLSAANLGRHLGVGAEESLREANGRFEGRFRAMEAAARERGQRLQDLDDAELDDLWEAVKAARGGG